MATSVLVSAAVEGIVDEAVVMRLIAEVGGQPGPVYGKNGKLHLLQRVSGYNKAAANSRWVILVDLDHDAECAPPFRERWLPDPAPQMCFRVAVREVEAWLLADRESLAKFLRVAVARIPETPETVDDPKQFMVDLARVSGRREIREDMIPRQGSGRTVGPAYASRLIEFVSDEESGWKPDIAARRSESLSRCLSCLRHLVER